MAEAEKQLVCAENFKKPGKLFDVACNGGFFMKVAENRGWQVAGNDISSQAVKWGRTHFGLNIIYDYLDDLKLNDNYYDAINLWNALEHTRRPVQTLKTCWNMLQRGGILMVQLPSKSPETIRRYYEQLHLFEWSGRDSDRLIKSVGFSKIWENIITSKNGSDAIERFYQKVEAE